MPAWRDILVTVVGLTPQVITETVYYLTQVHHPPIALTGLHVLTTQRGKAQLLMQLLAPQSGYFHAFCAEYGLDATAATGQCPYVLLVPIRKFMVL